MIDRERQFWHGWTAAIVFMFGIMLLLANVTINEAAVPGWVRWIVGGTLVLTSMVLCWWWEWRGT